ncbi:MAG TPA: COX15/CtaA family protein, partial [Gemmatimonadaceae bacterium]
MTTLRRLSYTALAVAYTHLVFGAIVRISGSGMGCGDNWPRCYGHWFPPFDQPTLVIEWTHRLIASILITAVTVLAVVAWTRRREPGVSGRGGVLRTAVGALATVLGAAVLGAVTVFLGNAPYATAAHWTVAMTLLAVLTMTAVRAGALGGASSAASTEQGSAATARLSAAAAALAFCTVIMGGLTAKLPDAAVACLD